MMYRDKRIKLNDDVSIKDLKKNKFFENRSNYTKSLPIYYYKFTPLITLNMIIDLEEKTFSYLVLDDNTNIIYPAYYNYFQQNNNKVVEEIEKKIEKELKKLEKGGILILE